MAGHSKFKNIQFRKGAQDKKRAKLFAKITSRKFLFISSAIFLSILKLQAITPPKALIGSHANADL